MYVNLSAWWAMFQRLTILIHNQGALRRELLI